MGNLPPGAQHELLRTKRDPCGGGVGVFNNPKPAGLEHIPEETWGKLLAETSMLSGRFNKVAFSCRFLCCYAMTFGLACPCL
ncbi:hypothetical protein TL16_g09166 [Triparma laevis f. inornata]|uniref:Uncharacterized protein n=2 Tax=Triparma laevis TaxID=1534972 RepID=A0A9W7A3H4_9STRA|nr:hypothetical protein TrLO_g5225 [Triparma laevis f. longispina]GMH82167.1 hypothetical protein TL16_g09166 [Triparma laevis f. inornata]